MVRIRNIAVVISVIMVSACVVVSDVIAAGERYTHAQYGFSLEFPKGWDVFETDDGFGSMSLESVDDAIDVAVSELPSHHNLQSFFEREKESISSDYDLLEDGQATIDGHDAAWVKYSYPLAGLTTIEMNYYVVKDGNLYEIQCRGNENSFSKNLPLYKNVIDSFRFSQS